MVTKKIIIIALAFALAAALSTWTILSRLASTGAPG